MYSQYQKAITKVLEEIYETIDDDTPSYYDAQTLIEIADAMKLPYFLNKDISSYEYRIESPSFDLMGVPEKIREEVVRRSPSYLDEDKRKEYYFFVKKNRTKVIAAIASTNQLLMAFPEFIRTNYSSSGNFFLRSSNSWGFKSTISEMITGTDNKEKLRPAIIEAAITEYKALISRLEKEIAYKKEQNNGIHIILRDKASKELDEDSSMEAVQNIGQNIPQGLTNRTWGFELEVANTKDVECEHAGIEFGSDSSIKSYDFDDDDCNCYCRDCTYHECNCDDCEMYNDDPEHNCGSSSCIRANSAEIRSIGGISKSHHAGLKDIVKKLVERNAEVNDTCGLHIHVYGKDLEPKQVATVMAAYQLVEPLFRGFCNRTESEYATSIPSIEIKSGFKNKFTFMKMRYVNISHLHASNERGTFEFRQAEATLSYDGIIGWAFIVRNLVTVVKRGAQMHHFFNINSFEELLKLYAKFNVTTQSENPEDAIPGSRNDKNLVTTHRLGAA